MFRRFFHKSKLPLTGAPTVRRMKTYSAQSGYVYQYFYQGYRPYAGSDGRGTEYLFQVSADRKEWVDLAVLVSDAAIENWQSSHARELSGTERYAVAKIALFQAFDERPGPAQMRDPVRVRSADIDGIVEALGL